jgi:hypothetical protein
MPSAPATPPDQVITRAALECACTDIIQHLSRNVRYKYAWQEAHYTDGSVSDDEQRGRLVSAAIYRTINGAEFLIWPCGHNTINRAELVAICHALADAASPEEDVLIFTDSQISIQLINRILRRPGKETGVHKDLLLHIAKLILDRARGGCQTSIHSQTSKSNPTLA